MDHWPGDVKASLSVSHATMEGRPARHEGVGGGRWRGGGPMVGVERPYSVVKKYLSFSQILFLYSFTTLLITMIKHKCNKDRSMKYKKTVFKCSFYVLKKLIFKAT